MGASVAENTVDLKQLPLRAIVAYAARCARRVQSHYVPPADHADAADCTAAIDAAIRVAESVAEGKPITAESAAQVEEATVRAILLVSGDENGSSAAAYAANAAYAAVDAATTTLSASGSNDLASLGERIADAAAIAFDAACSIREEVRRAAALDWEMLRRMQLGKFPNIGESVSALESGILGPLFRRQDGTTKRKTATKSQSAPGSTPKPETEAPIVAAKEKEAEQLRQAAEELNQRFEELRAAETQLAQDRDALDADRAALNSVNQDLERRRTEVEREAARLELERARGTSDAKAAETAAALLQRQEELIHKEKELETQKERLAADQQQFLAELQRLQAEKAEIEQLRRSLEQEASNRRGAQEAFEAQRRALDEERDRLQADRDAFEQMREQVQTRDARFEELSADLTRREEAIRTQLVALEEERNALVAKSSETERAALDLHEASERVRQERAQLRTQQDELRARTDEWLEQDRRFQEEREAVHAEAERIRRDAEQASSQLAELSQRQQEIESRHSALVTQEDALAEKQLQLEEATRNLQMREGAVAKERTEVDRLRREIDERRRQIDKEAADLKVHTAQVQAESARIQAERDELQAGFDDIRDQRVALESARQHLEHDRQRTRETTKEVERDKKKYAELRAQYEADQRALKVARDEIEGARTELRQQSEKLDAARLAFMEEKAQVTKKEADIHKALKQLRDERKRLQPEEDSLKSWSRQQTPKETVADLQVLLGRIHDERQRLKIEREQLAEVFSLISRGAGGTTAPRARALPEETRKRIEGPRLRMILDPGEATSADLGGLFQDLSTLDRLLGGPGVDFVVTECRNWRPGSGMLAATDTAASNRGDKPTDNERSFVEIYAVPLPPSGDAKIASSHWDRFTASLFVVLRLDAGQANYFELAAPAPRESPAHVLAADAAIRASRRPAKTSEAGLKPSSQEASVDAVNQHLQKIDDLRRKLEREDRLVLELAPALEIAEAAAETDAEPLTKTGSRRILKISAIAAAAVLLVAALLAYCVRSGPAHNDESLFKPAASRTGE